MADFLLGDIFTDLNPSDLYNFQNGDSWMSEIFETLDDQPAIGDGLLTDTVSEFMRNKPETFVSNDSIGSLKSASQPYQRVGGLEDVLVGDEIEIKDSFSQDRLNSDESSGYSSGVTSSGTSSPSNTVCKVELSDRPPSALKIQNVSPQKTISIKRIGLSPAPNFFTKNSSDSRVLQSDLRNTGRENRVHLILRPSETKFMPHQAPPECDITLNNDRGSACSVGAFQHYTDSETLRGVRTKVVTHPKPEILIYNHQSSTPSGSHSSSDSDAKDIFEEDLPSSSEFGASELSHSNAFDCYRNEKIHLSRRSKINSDYYDDMRACDSPLSGLSDFGSINYEDGSGLEFPRGSRMTNNPTLFANPNTNRIRGPSRTGRSELGHSSVLLLTDEEKRTLLAEGYSIPTRLPLSKQDERNLKKVRRKIKNKISAQESRRKKKEYLEALERKVTIYSQENLDLKRRVDGLESTNRSLLGQLRLLQQLVSKSKSNSPNQSVISESPKPINNHSLRTNTHNTSVQSGGGGASASTCLMVFALFFAALLVGQPSGTGSGSILDIRLSYSSERHNLFSGFASQNRKNMVFDSGATPGRFLYGPHIPPNLESNFYKSLYMHSHCNGEVISPNYTVPITNQVPDSKFEKTLNHHSDQKNRLPSNGRSRLLGTQDEFEDCMDVRSIWSFFFSNSVHQCVNRGFTYTNRLKDQLKLIESLEKQLIVASYDNTEPINSTHIDQQRINAKSQTPPVLEIIRPITVSMFF